MLPLTSSLSTSISYYWLLKPLNWLLTALTLKLTGWLILPECTLCEMWDTVFIGMNKISSMNTEIIITILSALFCPAFDFPCLMEICYNLAVSQTLMCSRLQDPVCTTVTHPFFIQPPWVMLEIKMFTRCGPPYSTPKFVASSHALQSWPTVYVAPNHFKPAERVVRFFMWCFGKTEVKCYLTITEKGVIYLALPQKL